MCKTILNGGAGAGTRHHLILSSCATIVALHARTLLIICINTAHSDCKQIKRQTTTITNEMLGS